MITIAGFVVAVVLMVGGLQLDKMTADRAERPARDGRHTPVPPC